MAVPKNKSYSAKSEIVFFDDFSANQFDRSRWNVRETGKTVNNEQQAYLDSEKTIYIGDSQDAPGCDGGALVLKAKYRPGFRTQDGKSFDFISGRIDTREKFEFTYGTAAARMKLPAGRGLWPAFWALGKDKWPATGEIDIMENIGETGWTSAGIHGPNYFGEAGLVNNQYFSPETDAAQWHTYSLNWFPEYLEFLVDNVIIYRVTRSMVEFHGEWVFDKPKFLILNFALGGTYPYKINGINSPYYGISEDAVKKIKDDQAKVLIDWVQVMR